MRVALLALLLVVPAAAAEDPGAPGRLPVGVTTLVIEEASRGRTLPTEVWYPAKEDGRDVRARRGRFPLVVVVHGLCGSRTNYKYLTVHLAAHGFVVAAPDFPWGADACAALRIDADPMRALTYLAAVLDVLRAPGARVPRPRGRRPALVGHSLGGMAVLNAAAAAPEAYAAVVALAPVTGGVQADMLAGATPRPAVLTIAGAADTTIPLSSVTTFFTHLVAPAYLVTLATGTHSGFTDMDAGLAPAALARQEVLTARYATAFLERYLARRRRFSRFLTRADAVAQGDDVTVIAAPAS